MVKRISSLLLCLVLCLSIFPAGAFAGEDEVLTETIEELPGENDYEEIFLKEEPIVEEPPAEEPIVEEPPEEEPIVEEPPAEEPIVEEPPEEEPIVEEPPAEEPIVEEPPEEEPIVEEPPVEEPVVEELPVEPVVVTFECAETADLSTLTVYDAEGAVVLPLSDVETGEPLYGTYSLLPGEYSYSFSAEGIAAPENVPFTVTGTEPAMTITLMQASAILKTTLLGADEAESKAVEYYDEKGEKQTANCILLYDCYTDPLTDKSITGGWYAVGENCEFLYDKSVEGDVHLILKDGCRYYPRNGYKIIFQENAKLTIYGQAEGSGIFSINKHEYTGSNATLTVNGGTLKGPGIQLPDIVVNRGKVSTGNITGNTLLINGGTVEATLGADTITINNGTVNATSVSEKQPGIYGKLITINGGNVTATGGKNAAGIGGRNGTIGETVIINGGSVNVKGGEGGAGIGGGYGSTGGTVNISNGSVNAEGGEGGAGIGGGQNGAGVHITIKGGSVTATGGGHADGIGRGGLGSNPGSFKVENDDLLVYAGESRETACLTSGMEYHYSRGKFVCIDGKTPYTVSHQLQTADGTGYEQRETETLYGIAGFQTEAVQNDYDGFACEEITQTEIAADGSTVIEVKYSRNSYTITFNANGLGTAPEAITARYGAPITKPADPEAAGYSFGGWFEDESCTTAFPFTVMPLDGKTLYAGWRHISHTYGDTAYTWDGAQCTAARSCTVCPEGVQGHTETETVTGIYAQDTPPTCTKAETGHYTATFVNTAFKPQVKSVTVGNPLGHSYGTPTYMWNDAQCTAARSCSRCAEGADGHSETETVTGIYTKEAETTCTEAEKGHYTATFVNTVFEQQVTSVTKGSPLGHDYRAEQYDATQHRLICRNNAEHTSFEAHSFHGNTCMACGYVKSDRYLIIYGANGVWTKRDHAALPFTSNAPFDKFDSVKVDGGVIPKSCYAAAEGSTDVDLLPAYLETLRIGTHSLDIVSVDGTASTVFTVKAAPVYRVSFNMCGHGTQVPAQYVEKESTVIRPEVPYESGYTFIGWYADAAYRTKYDFNTPVRGDMVLYARWVYGEYPQTGDGSQIALWAALFSASGIALAGSAALRKKKRQ